MAQLGANLEKEYPESNPGFGVAVIPMSQFWVGPAREMLTMVLLAVGLVLTIGCVNIASLLLARGGARQRELAVRSAIGGSRGRLIRQLLTESLVLSVLGAIVALTLAALALPALDRILPVTITALPFRNLQAIGLSVPAFAFAFGVSVLAALAFGLVPALKVLPAGPAAVLKEGQARGTTSRGGRRLQGVLVTAEVALAIVVLAGSLLLITSMRRVLQVNPGIEPEHLLVMYDMSLPQVDTYGAPERETFCSDVIREVAGVPGVQGVSAVSHLPLSDADAGRSFVIEGEPDPGADEQPHASFGISCPGYFGVMGIPLRAGRDFTERDWTAAPAVGIVNELFARRYLPVGNPVGRRIKLGSFGSDAPWITIVGVAADTRHWGLLFDVLPYLYRPYSQSVWPNMNILVRDTGRVTALAAPVRAALAKAEPDLPIGGSGLMTDVVDRSLGYPRFPAGVLSAFGLMALVSGGSGDPRGGEPCRGAAHPGIRHPHRTRRPSRLGVDPGAGPAAPARGLGTRARDDGRRRSDPAPPRSPLRGVPGRSRHLPGRGRVAHHRGPPRGSHPGRQSGEAGSGEGAKGRVRGTRGAPLPSALRSPSYAPPRTACTLLSGMTVFSSSSWDGTLGGRTRSKRCWLPPAPATAGGRV